MVTVIITTHNRAAMLVESLDSVFAQSCRSFEIVVVDDGSVDETRRVVGAYGNRVQYIYQENRGRTAAINTGIARARGLYIAFLDDDDRWLPHKLERQLLAFRRFPHADVVHSFVYLVHGARRTCWDGDAPASASLFERLLTGRFVSTPSGIMLKRAVLDRVGLFDAGMCPCDDWELWIRIACAGGRFHLIEEPLVEYRVHSSNMSGDVERMHAARIAVLTKVFAAPGTPDHIKAMKRRYLARLWLRIGDDRYVRSQVGAARAAWWKAAQTDPFVVTPTLLSLMGRTFVGERGLRWGREIRQTVRNLRQRQMRH